MSADDFQFECLNAEKVEARRRWFKAGMQGHYPDCPCDSCKTRIRILEAQQ